MERKWIGRLALIALFVFLALPGTVLAFDVDIKPGNTEADAPFNMGSLGVTPVVISGSPELDVLTITSVVISTINSTSLGVPISPVKFAYELQGEWELDPVLDENGNQVYQNVFVPYDDFLDLVIHFDTQSIATEIKNVLVDIAPGDIVTLGFTAEPGTLTGEDTIRIIIDQKPKPGKKS